MSCRPTTAEERPLHYVVKARRTARCATFSRSCRFVCQYPQSSAPGPHHPAQANNRLPVLRTQVHARVPPPSVSCLIMHLGFLGRAGAWRGSAVAWGRG